MKSSSRALMVASVAAVVALVVLGGVVGSALVSITRANETVTAARNVITPYLALQDGVSAEASAEAGYRRAPSPEARRAIDAAVRKVDRVLPKVHRVADPVDRSTVSYLSMLNDRYVGEMRRTLDQPVSRHPDDRVAGPALDAMQSLLTAAVTKHRDDARRANTRQATIIRHLDVVLPAVFLVALAVVGWTGLVLLRAQRHLGREAAASESRALSDSLTGLPNRVALRREVEATLQRPRSFGALLYLDLDRFKPVNDTLGHHAGDLVLCEVAQRLLSTVRAGETVARLGGDEFAVFLPRGFAATTVAGRIIEAIEQPMHIDGQVVSIGTSIGIARFPEDAVAYDALLRAADAALYVAKQQGRGRMHEVPALAHAEAS